MAKVTPYSAYIDMSEQQAKGFFIDFVDDVTGVVNVNGNDSGNASTELSTGWYNIMGQHVNENAKGIIIKNGKKFRPVRLNIDFKQ